MSSTAITRHRILMPARQPGPVGAAKSNKNEGTHRRQNSGSGIRSHRGIANSDGEKSPKSKKVHKRRLSRDEKFERAMKIANRTYKNPILIETNFKNGELFHLVSEGTNDASAKLYCQTKREFDDTSEQLGQEQQQIVARNNEFIEAMQVEVKALTTPLRDEQVHTTIKRDGGLVEEIAQIGERVDAFRTIILDEAALLNASWEEWEKLQDEYLQLGIDAFGAENFDVGMSQMSQMSVDGEEQRTVQIGSEMQVQEEYQTIAEEIEEMVDDVENEYYQEMKVTEKEMDITVKKEQTRLLQRLL